MVQGLILKHLINVAFQDKEKYDYILSRSMLSKKLIEEKNGN